MNFCLGHVTDTTDITYFLSIMFGIFFKCMGFFFLKKEMIRAHSHKWFYEETFFENLRNQIFLAHLRQPIMKKWVASAHPVPILMFRQNHIPK